MKLPDYLESIRVQLTMKPKAAERIVIEIQQHLADQTKQHLLNGVTVQEAETLACEQFGQPAAVAARFNKTYRHPLHSFWIVVGMVLLIYTLIRFLIALDFVLYMDSFRGFSLTIGPGFYDTRYTVYSSLAMALAGVLMARFIYRYLARLHIAVQTLRLSSLLATGIVAFYHLILSLLQYLIGITVFGQLIEGVDNYGDPIYFGNVQLPIDRVVYYIAINLFYVGLTTVVVLISMQFTFWWLQRHSREPMTTIIDE
jgi:hypothetical protein